MSRTDIERYDQALKHLRSVSATLATEVDQLVRTKDKKAFGALLSLKGIWSKGHLWRGQHDAMRALMLCQAVYLQPPYARKRVQDRTMTMVEGKPKVEITGFHYDDYHVAYHMDPATAPVRNMSVSQINERILAYIPLANPSRAGLAEAANCAGGVEESSIDYLDYSRASSIQFKNAICYDAVKQFLFKAGFISIRWLLHHGPSLESHTANDLLGYGRVVTKEDLASAQAGLIFNFHGGEKSGRNNKDVCHWGVTLGGGLGSATNTTKSEGDKTVKCKGGVIGPGVWGKFSLVESYEVCEIKYGKERDCPTIIRLIDPVGIEGFF